jgi:hypothetical protein
MSISMEIRVESALLRATCSGSFSLEEAKRVFLEALHAAVLQGVNKVLFDGRTLTGELPTLERFHLAKFSAESVVQLQGRGLPAGIKFACVLEEPLLDPERFGETVAVNRGLFMKAFDNVDEALEWLEETSEDGLNIVGDGTSETIHPA